MWCTGTITGEYLGLAEKVQSIEHQIIVFVFIENMQENVCL